MKRLLGLAIAVAVLFPACSAAQASSTIDVDLLEFSIETSSGVYTPGDVQLNITNSGQFPHTLVVTDASGHVVRATDLIHPGQALEIELGLPAGTFEFTCRIVTQGDGGVLFDHFEEGMHARVASKA